MFDMYDLAYNMFVDDNPQGNPTPTVINGVAMSDSEDGEVLVALDEDEEPVSMPCVAAIRAGKQVIVHVTNGSGVVIGYAGSGDDTAQDVFNSISTSEYAASIADEAKEAAEYAFSEASTAIENAADAAKSATDYIEFIEGEGVVVGDMTTGDLGSNVLISSSSVNVRSGSDTIASFNKDKVTLNNGNTYIENVDINESSETYIYGKDGVTLSTRNHGEPGTRSSTISVFEDDNGYGTAYISGVNVGIEASNDIKIKCSQNAHATINNAPIMTAAAGTRYATSGTLTTNSSKLTLAGTVPCWSNNEFRNEENGILCNFNGYVIVSAQMHVNGIYRADAATLRLYQGVSGSPGTCIGFARTIGGYASSGTTALQQTVTIPPRVVSVSQGDLFTIYGQGSAARGTYGNSDGNTTWLTVQALRIDSSTIAGGSSW